MCWLSTASAGMKPGFAAAGVGVAIVSKGAGGSLGVSRMCGISGALGVGVSRTGGRGTPATVALAVPGSSTLSVGRVASVRCHDLSASQYTQLSC